MAGGVMTAALRPSRLRAAGVRGMTREVFEKDVVQRAIEQFEGERRQTAGGAAVDFE